MPRLPDTVDGRKSTDESRESGLWDTVERLAPQAGPSSEVPASYPVGASRYTVLGVLGEGGMGRVFEARDEQFGRIVAVKELRPKADGIGRHQRFEIEALITGNLEHPGIPVVHERGSRDGSPFYAMHRVSGTTFARSIAQAKTLDERMRLLPVLVKVAHTLAYVHERGVVHRDIKPDNIISGRHGETVLIDWGIAKILGRPGDERTTATTLQLELDGALTQHGSTIGTPSYMSPEQARGEVDRIDARSDVFALGAVLYHLLAGEPPYTGTAQQAAGKAKESDHAPIAARAPGAPLELRAICEKAMKPAMDDRYRDANEMADALESFVARAVTGRPTIAMRVVLGLFFAAAALMFAGMIFNLSFLPLGDLGIAPTVMLTGTLVGCVLSVSELVTKGKFRLESLAIGIAIVTILLAVASAVSGGAIILGKLQLLDLAVAADALEFKRVVLVGTREAISTIGVGAALTSVQVLVWAFVRRSTL